MNQPLQPTQSFPHGTIPPGGLNLYADPGNTLTAVHLDYGVDGTSLAIVGAAGGVFQPGNRAIVAINNTDQGSPGISLAMVGAAIS
jgi:hypothetical protein